MMHVRSTLDWSQSNNIFCFLFKALASSESIKYLVDLILQKVRVEWYNGKFLTVRITSRGSFTLIMHLKLFC